MAGDDRWDPVAATFVDHYDSLYGQVRTHVLHAHLLDHLPGTPCDVVDVGGGAGNQSIPLARLGHRVTIVDPSAPMLAAAAAALERETQEVARRVRCVQAEGEDTSQIFGDDRFDAVLCHGVLMYLDDPDALVAALAGLAKPGALVSIVTKNRQALAMRPGLDGDWLVALDAFDAERQVNGLDLDTRADDPDELSGLLARFGVEPLARYGVRLFTEGWARDRPPTDPADQVLAVELEASRRDPYRQLSRLFHLVGRRR